MRLERAEERTQSKSEAPQDHAGLARRIAMREEHDDEILVDRRSF